MKILWITDIHLNLVSTAGFSVFFSKIASLKPDALLIGGDIADSKTLIDDLLVFEEKIQCPIYFVLGNHDYYHSSIKDVRKQVGEMVKSSSRLKYLTNTSVIKLTPDTCLIGHDSWSDGRYGDYFGSNVRLNDYVMIEDLKDLDKQSRLEKLNELGDEAASFFREKLSEALLDYQHIIVLTHVPPFVEACWHEGNLSDDNFLPHFSCKAAGDVFIELMSQYPDKNMTVLCGHTHSAGIAQILPNLIVITGAAVYGKPTVQAPIFIKE